MHLFLIISGYGFFIAAVGDFLILLALSYAGTGFGFGDLRKDVLKILAVSVIVGLIDGAWSLSPGQSFAFYAITAVIHSVVLRLFFFDDISNTEAGIVAVGRQIIYMIVLVAILAALASHPQRNAQADGPRAAPPVFIGVAVSTTDWPEDTWLDYSVRRYSIQ
jgi:hypothetical protein